LTGGRIGPISESSRVLVEGDEHCDGCCCVFAAQNNEGITQREGISWSYAIEPACIGSSSKLGPAPGAEGKYHKVLGFRYPGNTNE